jgi:hypothetical protein
MLSWSWTLNDTNLAHVLGELTRLDEVLRVSVAAMRAERAAAGQGLFIADAEVDRLLDKPPCILPTIKETSRPAVAPAPGLALRLPRLAAAFDLNRFECDVVLLCLAPELDRKYERIYAYLHDDVQAGSPTVGLALNLFCSNLQEQVQARFSFQDSDAPLRSAILVTPADSSSSLLARSLRLDTRVVEFLLGSDTLDSLLRWPLPIARWKTPALAPVPLWNARHQAEIKTLEAAPAADRDWLCLLSGPEGSGKKTFAGALCHARHAPLLVCDLNAAAASASLETVLHRLFREARFYDAPVYLDGWHALREPGQSAVIMDHVERFPGLVFLATTGHWRTPRIERSPRVEIELGIPDEPLRRELWSRHVDSSETAGQLANLFRFVPGQIESAADRARNAALANNQHYPDSNGFFSACRTLSSINLVSFAAKVPARRTWDDLVLPKQVLEQLHELCGQVRHRARVYVEWNFREKVALGSGVLALFSGPSGTGKTMSAEVIAGALGLELFKIDLSSLISKYIGDTEKNLARVFEDGERSGGILFFDEADSVFGKRTEAKDAHDRYANIETNYLLQRIEDYPGVVILASNMGRNIDPAFQRRMNFAIEFPFPDTDYRERIWRNVFPPAAPLESDVDFAFLAEKFLLAGGNIRNIALSAAFRAAGNGGAINMHHLILSVRREYQKMGKVCERSEFGDYYKLVR